MLKDRSPNDGVWFHKIARIMTWNFTEAARAQLFWKATNIYRTFFSCKLKMKAQTKSSLDSSVSLSQHTQAFSMLANAKQLQQKDNNVATNRMRDI